MQWWDNTGTGFEIPAIPGLVGTNVRWHFVTPLWGNDGVPSYGPTQPDYFAPIVFVGSLSAGEIDLSGGNGSADSGIAITKIG